MSTPAPEEILAVLREHVEIRCRTCGAHDVEIILLPPKPEPEPAPLGVGQRRGFEHGPAPEQVDAEPDEDPQPEGA